MAEMHQRIKTRLEFATESPVLQLGEHGLESDTGLFKIGDGKTRYNSLKYYGKQDPVAPIATDGFITVVEHGDDPNYQRPLSAKVVYWLGSVEPLNSLDDDLWSEEVDTP